MDAANVVFLISSFKLSLFTPILLSWFTMPMAGNSSAGRDTMEKCDPKQRISIFPSSSSICRTALGSLRMISENSFEETTALPSSAACTSIFVSMERSRSDAVTVSSFPFTVRRIPFRMGMVVRMETALDTVFSALVKAPCEHVNFIRLLLIFFQYF